MGQFEVSGDPAGGVVRVRGEFDMAVVGDVHRAILAVEEARPEVLALDLREVALIDSTGLRVILDAAARAREDDRRLVIVARTDGPVGRVLELTLVADHLEVVGDLAAARR
jgi:anti-anti-sigma factor